MWAAETLFWFSAVLVAYTYLGYPLIIVLLGRFRKNSMVAPSADLPPVTLIVVVFNEAGRILAKIESVFASDYPPEKLHVIVVSDGSTDTTVEAVRAVAGDRITVLDCHERRGKSACVADAIAAARTELLVLTDARQALAQDAVRKLVDAMADRRLGAVSGALVFRPSLHSGTAQGVDFYWRYEKVIREAEARFDSAIGVTGALYILRKSAFRSLPPGIILDDVWVPMQATQMGFRVGFAANAAAYDDAASDLATERRRKIRTLAGNWQLLERQSWLLDPRRNRLWWQFMSHKVLRLIAPLLLLLALISNLVLAPQSRFYAFLLGVQGIFYLLAVLGANETIRRHFLPARICQVFLSLNWFAVEGLVEHRRNRAAFLWR